MFWRTGFNLNIQRCSDAGFAQDKDDTVNNVVSETAFKWTVNTKMLIDEIERNKR